MKSQPSTFASPFRSGSFDDIGSSDKSSLPLQSLDFAENWKAIFHSHQFEFFSETQMEDSGKHGNNSKFLNPWMLQFQKMGLELKCPLCLNLFKRPMLLPCNHIFCSPCIADCSRPSSECAVCNMQHAQRG